MSLLVNPVISTALDALAERQRVIARNVANIHTPGYTAQVVDFEAALAQAVDAGNPEESISATDLMTIGTSADPAGLNGNNVSLEKETLNGSETNLRYSLALRAVEGRLNGMRDVLRST